MMETVRYVLAPIVVSVIVGIGASFLSLKIMMAKVRERVSQVEAKAANNREDIKEHIKEQFTVTDRLARIETRLDTIINRLNRDNDA